MTVRCVVDSSVAAKLFLAEPHSPKAKALFDLLATRESVVFHVPDAFYYEVPSTLRRYALAGTYPHVRRDVARLLGLKLRVTPISALVLDALETSLTHTISFYDALYLALAARVNAPFITADERLARSVQNTPFDVRTLATLDLTALGDL